MVRECDHDMIDMPSHARAAMIGAQRAQAARG
jgi:hypothetical protein